MSRIYLRRTGEIIMSVLLSIKRRYDPDGVFWCAPCVGGEDWKLEGGKLCRA